MRRAALLLSILIALGSGCAKPTPVLLPLTQCPAPALPPLPRVDGDVPLDTPANVRALMDKESLLRRHVDGLKAALRCYDSQVEASHELE